MKVLEAIQTNPVFSSVAVEHIQKLLDSRSINGTAIYSASDLKNVELISADLYVDIAMMPELREGQLSLKYDKGLLLKRAKAIYVKYKDPKATDLLKNLVSPTIKFSEI